MEATELLEQLGELAREAGLRVRQIGGRAGGDGEPSASSAVVRVRGETWVVLSAVDSVEERIRVLAEALRDFAPELLETRYLAPALRARLAPDDDTG